MKKLLLLVILMSFLTVNAQNDRNGFRASSPHQPPTYYSDQFVASQNTMPGLNAPLTYAAFKDQRDINTVIPIQIGQSANAFGFAFMRTTYLWADDNINTVTFMHRMNTTPGSGYLAYDISKGGGLDGTWQNNVQTYDPTLTDAFPARYPQGAIYNPVGNADPDAAFYHYFAPTLDGSNTSGTLNWGGYAFGAKSLADGSTATQHNEPSSPPFYHYLPSGFTITQPGEAWMVDENAEPDGAGGYTYMNEINIGRGIWDVDESDFIYTFDLLGLEINPGDGVNDIKIAFAPDGMTGYIILMSQLPDVLPYTSYHPILLKTTDGGETWSDPIEVQLGGEDGLDAVKQFITDENLVNFFTPDPVPPRDEIDYFMGYEIDLSVDAWGNPHIVGVVCIADNVAGSIYPNEGLMAMFHIWSDDQGETFRAFNLGNVKRWSVEFTGGGSTIAQYNRPQAATTMDGAIVFFSWLDTEVPEVEDNSQPDIFFREYLPTMDMHGDTSENVTTFSAAMWSAFFGCMSHYVFADVTETDYTCTIPFAYTSKPTDPTLPVQFWYIPDFVKSYTITGISDKEIKKPVTVSQNFPNPFSQTSRIQVNMPENASLKLVVTNLLGQQVMEINRGEVPAGQHEFVIDGSKLGKGIYFYTVFAGNETITNKMIIE
jgi:hypothetical protein